MKKKKPSEECGYWDELNRSEKLMVKQFIEQVKESKRSEIGGMLVGLVEGVHAIHGLGYHSNKRQSRKELLLEEISTDVEDILERLKALQGCV